MNVSAEQKKAKREHILSEGIKLMHAKGYNGTGVKDISDAAGVPKGSFYNYFSSKEEFALSAMQFYYESYAAPGNEYLTHSDEAPLERLRRHFENSRNSIVENQHFMGGCFINNMCQEMADQSESFAANISAHICRSRSAIAACLAEAQQAGDISSDLDVKSLAQFIDNAWRGVITSAKAQKSAAEFDDFMEIVFNKLLK